MEEVAPISLLNLAVMINGMVLRYLRGYEVYKKKDGNLSFTKWMQSMYMDVSISFFCSPMLVVFSNTIIHYLAEVEVDKELLTDNIFYAVGGYSGSDAFRWATDFLSRQVKWLLNIKE